ncbi:hypothetical protein HanIR_Chr07g0320151 [Helianthus annuus]|nr:hypothetical protein HanIR_Chr07g0320151 [Helianthus annuus]
MMTDDNDDDHHHLTWWWGGVVGEDVGGRWRKTVMGMGMVELKKPRCKNLNQSTTLKLSCVTSFHLMILTSFQEI